MRRLGGFLLIAVGIALMVAQSVQASGNRVDGFDSLVKALSARYAVKPKKIPMMWAVSLCARGFTHGGVRGMRIVEFDGLDEVPDRTAFEEMVRSRLGEDWSQMVRQRESSGEESLVYMRGEGSRTELVVANLNQGELDLVRMEMNPEQLAQWMRKKDLRSHRQ